VKIGGVTVGRATLHNEDEIRRKDIRIGDTVLVQRAGDVIPEIVKVITSKRAGEERIFKMPLNCPVCGSPVIRAQDEAALRCIDLFCSAQIKQRIKHFASKGAFDIDGLGSKLIEQLVDKDLLFSYGDIFRLKEDTLENLERMGSKSAANILSAIEKSKKITLSRFLYALGIRHVGDHVAGIIAKTFGRMEILMNATPDELEAIEGVGPVVADSVGSFFGNDENRKIVDEIITGGVQILGEGVQEEGALSGRVFVLTGTLSTLTRDKAKKLIEKAGGKVTGSISRNTDYLVAGASPGSKLRRAEGLGVEIIDEETLMRLMIED
jgi:DNA ligase (NAD+)